jgi:hypothetical protein
VEAIFNRGIHTDSAIVGPELYPSLIEFNRKIQHPAMRTVVAEAAAGH